MPADTSVFNADGALVGKNPVFDISGTGNGLAATLAEQDADLISASGTISLAPGATFQAVIDADSGTTEEQLEQALSLAGNSAGEILYLVARSEAGSADRLSSVALGDVDYRYLDDAGDTVAADDLWTNLVLVLSGPSGRIVDAPIGISASTLIRPEHIRPDGETGCLPGKVLLFNELDDGTANCVWMEVSGVRGSDFELGDIDEDLREYEYNVGIEARVNLLRHAETRLGVALGARSSSLDQSEGGELDDDVFRAGAYADIRRGPMDYRLSAIYGNHYDIEQSRRGVGGERLRGEYEAQSWSLNAGATRWYYVDACWDVGPTATLSWTTVDRDAFSETVRSGSGLERFRYQSESDDALWGFLGVSARYRREERDRASDFNATVGVETTLSGGDFGWSGFYLEDAGRTVFSGTDQSRYEDTAIKAQVDMTSKVSESVSWSVGFGGRFARDGTDYSASLE